MKSMTGFGKSTSQTNDLQLEVSAKAVNGRYLEVKIHGPKIYAGFESEIRKKVNKYIKRGTLDIFINRKVFNSSEEVVFNKGLAKKWLKGFNQLSKELKLSAPTQSDVLLQIPDLMQLHEATQVSAKEKKLFFQAVEESVSACAKLRASEGASLKKDLLGHLSSLEKQSVQISKVKKQTNKDLKAKLQQRLEKLSMPGQVDEQRLAQEIVILVDKSDISEELQRLDAHLKAITKLLGASGSIGKKLDFYAQELLREVNTIGSKSTSSALTQLVVDSKALIERYREQVQNVE